MKKLSQTEWIAVVIGLIVVVLVFYLFIPINFFDEGIDKDLSDNQESKVVEKITKESGLVVQDLTVGEGDVAEVGKIVVVHYVGTFKDGTKFDSSVDRGQPFVFILGKGQVIAGWDEGVAGMRVGGRRILNIPSNLAYGASGAGSIPPNTDLVFEVVLLDVRDNSSSE